MGGGGGLKGGGGGGGHVPSENIVYFTNSFPRNIKYTLLILVVFLY